MWFWIILAAVISKNTITSFAGPVDAEYPEIPDDASLLYMDERSLNDQQSDDNEIEARRRSALDKNFMRFGRGDNDLLPPEIYNDEEEYDKFNRPARTNHKNKNIVRFGRGKTGDFIRFGRSYMDRDTRSQDKNFIRFGRSVPATRTRRDVYHSYVPPKRDHKNMFRFGRNDNFMRFGRMPMYENDQESRKNMSSIRELLENSVPNLFPLLQQLVQRLRNETMCNGCRLT